MLDFEIDENRSDRLTLLLPPSVNNAYRNVRINKRIKTEKAVEFIETAGWQAKSWAMKNGWHMPKESQKVILRVWIWWGNTNRRDPDNIFKLLNDAIKGVLVHDDCMILPQVMDFSTDPKNPRVELELEVMNP